jgi:hypothetical protein
MMIFNLSVSARFVAAAVRFSSRWRDLVISKKGQRAFEARQKADRFPSIKNTVRLKPAR